MDYSHIFPDFVRARDPLLADDPATSANESEMDFSWQRMDQWTSTCEATASVPYVTSSRHSKRVKSGTTCHRVGKVTSCHARYTTKSWTTYHQKHETKCIKYKFTRLCESGQALYRKQPEGTCAREPSQTSDGAVQLVDIGSLSFMCPKDYKSGTPGGHHYDRRCRCPQQSGCS